MAVSSVPGAGGAVGFGISPKSSVGQNRVGLRAQGTGGGLQQPEETGLAPGDA